MKDFLSRIPLFDERFERQMRLCAKIAESVYASCAPSTDKSGDILYQPPHRNLAGGTEITGYRDYSPGDDLHSVDWGYCARMDELLVREYKSSARQYCHILVDKSESMRLVPPRAVTSKLDTATRLAAILAFVAVRRNNQVNVYTYDDQLQSAEHAIGAEGDIGFALKFFRDATETESKKSTSFLNAAQKLAQMDSHKGAVLILTDMYDDSFPQGLSLLQQAGYSPRVLRLYSDFERGVGLFGDITVVDAETGRSWNLTITQAQLKYFQKKFNENTERIRRWSLRYGAKFQNVYCDQPATQACLEALGLRK